MSFLELFGQERAALKTIQINIQSHFGLCSVLVSTVSCASECHNLITGVGKSFFLSVRSFPPSALSCSEMGRADISNLLSQPIRLLLSSPFLLVAV